MTEASEARAWIDGASRGDPGEAGFGVKIERGGDTHELCGFLGRTTHNVAEYAALVAALTWAVDSGVERLEMATDSELLVRQVEGGYTVKAPHLVPIFLKVLTLRRRLAAFEIRQVGSDENRDADRLANRAIDERQPLPEWLELELPTE